MKRLRIIFFIYAILSTPLTSQADHSVHKFEAWGMLQESEKIPVYMGWADGLLFAAAPRTTALAACLETISYAQATAMIDKYYKDHPERWSHILGEEILNALTIEGGPCAGKSPFVPTR